MTQIVNNDNKTKEQMVQALILLQLITLLIYMMSVKSGDPLHTIYVESFIIGFIIVSQSAQNAHYAPVLIHLSVQ